MLIIHYACVKDDGGNLWCHFDMQRQLAERSTDYLVNNSFFVISEPFCVEDDDYLSDIEFDYLNSCLTIITDLPEIGGGVKYRKIELVNTDGKKPFCECVHYTIGEDGFSEPDIPNEWYKNTLSLDISAMKISSAGTYRFYFTCLPTTTGKFIVKATAENGDVYSSDVLASKSLKVYKSYVVTAKNMHKTTSDPNTERGYEYVDLGLPSGLKWAKMNLGATSVTDCGKYYAWGEIASLGEEDVDNLINYEDNLANGYTSNPYIKYGGHDTYKWYSKDHSKFTKYCLSYEDGNYDNKKTLSLWDDAARVNMLGGWRIPTAAEMTEIIDNCYWVWTEGYNGTGVKGYIVYKALQPSHKGLFVNYCQQPSNSYNLSKPHIFLPAAGNCNHCSPFHGYLKSRVNVIGEYWTSNLDESEYRHSKYARTLYFDKGHRTMGGSVRYDGYSIRAVCK